MNWFREIGRRLWTLIHRNQFDSDLQEEMRLHRELCEQEEIERGLCISEARIPPVRASGSACRAGRAETDFLSLDRRNKIG